MDTRIRMALGRQELSQKHSEGKRSSRTDMNLLKFTLIGLEIAALLYLAGCTLPAPLR